MIHSESPHLTNLVRRVSHENRSVMEPSGTDAFFKRNYGTFRSRVPQVVKTDFLRQFPVAVFFCEVLCISHCESWDIRGVVFLVQFEENEPKHLALEGNDGTQR